MAPQRGRALAAGLPLIVLTVGGWLGLSVFLKDRFAVQVGPELKGMGLRETLHSLPAPQRRLPALTAAAAPPSRECVQDAHSKGVDLHAPVERQRAKRFSVEEELQVGAVASSASLAGPLGLGGLEE